MSRSEVLTDTNYFRVGAQWPPMNFVDRQNRFADMKALYEHSQAIYRILYPQTLAGVAREKGFQSVDDVAQLMPHVKVNLFRKVSNLWSLMLYAHPPTLDAGEEGPNATIKPFVTPIVNAGKRIAIDNSRYGGGVLLLTESNGGLRLRVVDPAHWFPVVSPDDPDTIIGDYICVPFQSKPQEVNALADRLMVTRMVVGQEITTKIFQLENSGVLGAPSSEKNYPALQRRSILQVNNFLTEGFFGQSDYPDLIEVVAEINRRLSGNSRTMDRFGNPHLYGLRSAVTTGPNGKPQVNIGGDYFPIEEGEEPPGYLVWEAGLESNFTQLTWAKNMFYMLSDTSEAAMGIQGDGNSVESGAALRKHLHNSLLRLGLLRREHTELIRAIVSFIAPRANLNVAWSNPYMESLLEAAQAEETRIGSGTTTRRDAIMRLDSVDSQEAQRIATEAANERPNNPEPNPNPPANQAGNSG